MVLDHMLQHPLSAQACFRCDVPDSTNLDVKSLIHNSQSLEYIRATSLLFQSRFTNPSAQNRLRSSHSLKVEITQTTNRVGLFLKRDLTRLQFSDTCKVLINHSSDTNCQSSETNCSSLDAHCSLMRSTVDRLAADLTLLEDDLRCRWGQICCRANSLHSRRSPPCAMTPSAHR